MSKRKKTKTLLKKSKKVNKRGIFIISFCMLIILGLMVFFIVDRNSYATGKVEYYTGNYDSSLYAANLVDMVDNNGNILISPFNFNMNLAYIYNGTDNNSRYEIKSYFKKDLKKINEEVNKKMNIIGENNEKTEFDLLYDKLINEFISNGYNEYSLSDIGLLSKDGKKTLQLLLKKMSLTYERIVGNNDFNLATIENYTLSEKEIIDSDYLLKSFLDKCLSNTEKYIIKNSVTNYIGIYSKNLSNTELNDNFKNNTKIYNVEVNNEYEISNVNTKLKEITDNKIRRINDTKIFDNSLVMVNSLYFDYTWEIPFKVSQVQDSVFYNNDGTYSAIQMMYSEENLYLENEYIKGFIKYFKDKKYSFIGIIPKDNGNIELSNLNLASLIKNVKKKTILIGLPKFEYQAETDLKKLHEKMGITDIYSDKANFMGMTDKNIKIDENIQKVTITIGENGTSNSKVVPDNIGTFTHGEVEESIILDRSFIFLIINNETNDVMLIGKVNKL